MGIRMELGAGRPVSGRETLTSTREGVATNASLARLTPSPLISVLGMGGHVGGATYCARKKECACPSRTCSCKPTHPTDG